MGLPANILSGMSPLRTVLDPPARLRPPQNLLRRCCRAEDDALLVKLLEGIRKRDQAALSRFYDLTVSRGCSIGFALCAPKWPRKWSDVYMQAWRDAYRYEPRVAF